MQSFKERILIPLETYETLKQGGNTEQTIPSMQRDLANIPKTYGLDLPDDQRQKLEGEVIDRYSSHKPQETPSSSSPQIESNRLDDVILGFPKTIKTKAKQLVQFLKSQGMFYNDTLNLLIDNQPIPNSNIVDLIHYITSVTSKTRTNPPPGFEYFIQKLNNLNVPKSYLSPYGRTLLEAYEGTTVDDKHVEEDIMTNWDALEYE